MPDAAVRLSPREEQILLLRGEGKSYKTIAADLAISESTVRLHVHHAIEKLGAESSAEAFHLYQKTLNKRPA